MAVLIKSNARRYIGENVLAQWKQVSVAGRTLPQTTTDILFRVLNGRVLCHLLLGEVTTIIQNSDPVLKVSSKKLSLASLAVGTAVDIASTVDITSLEVGGLIVVLGSGAALVKNNAGAGLSTLGRNEFILPQGEVYITTGASKTGAIKWDLWYQELDASAQVAPVNAATVAI